MMLDKNFSGTVYLYQRFSSVKQEGNSSLHRQGEAQKRWLEEHPNCVVGELENGSFVDEGISGFKGKHLESGSLGRLVCAIEKGFVAPGSLILVEHFSRLSRMDIEHTEELLRRIWKHDVSVVTARDNNYYPPSSVNDVPTRLKLMFEIENAHSDSKWRSEKVKGSWKRRESNAREKGIAPRMRYPFWLSKEGKLNEYAPIVKDIFSLHASGKGQVIIERTLREKYGAIGPLKNINPTKIMRIIENPRCIGLVYGKRLLEPVVSDFVFYQAQRIREERLFTSIRPTRVWPLSGMIKCGLCGSGLSIQQTKNALPLLRCSRKQRSGGEICSSSTTFPYVIAHHFFRYFVQPIMLSVISNNERSEKLRLEAGKIKAELKNQRKAFSEAKSQYDKTVSKGGNGSFLLGIMDEHNTKIDKLNANLELINIKINKRTTFDNISKSAVDLSVNDPRAFNIQLNMTGLKVSLKNKTLEFKIDEDSSPICTMTYLGYSRKEQGYDYIFEGEEEFFKQTSHQGIIRSSDWTAETLMNPNSGPLDAKVAARAIKNIELDTSTNKPRILTHD